MSRSKTWSPPSLAQHFDAPTDYTGHFGWLCGYSADAAFLDDAAERFTRLTRSQRAYEGRLSLAVMLDPGNPHISLADAPGVAHLLIKGTVKKPFQLLHAKVALLGFRHQENRDQWRLRLLVSTGNWTRQTLEESLDLIWRIDIDSQSLQAGDDGIQQDCADITAAWGLLEWIQIHFDKRLLEVNDKASTEISEWIRTCKTSGQPKPRFFDNRSASLLEQLPEKVQACGGVERDYLAMGSGFYEGPASPAKVPEVPINIIKVLKQKSLLTTKPKVDMYVNPQACQAIATSVKELTKCDITTRPPGIPSMFGENSQRSLHAKFLFSANHRENSNDFSSAWVYLGSGNLTKPGFVNKMSQNAGNLEAGVVFAPGKLCKKENKNDARLALANLLPVQWGTQIEDTEALQPGSGMEPRDVVHVAPPIAWLEWVKLEDGHELQPDENFSTEIQLLDPAGKPCEKTTSGFRWNETQPREVCIRWQENKALIPVVDQYGRIAATELPAIGTTDEAWWQLAAFPMPPDTDEDDIEDGEAQQSSGNNAARPSTNASYPIRQMMELIENIAAKQTTINEMDWTLWCNRLEQALGQASESAPVRYFREDLKLNPLSPLRHSPFRPSFAECDASESGRLYVATLERIEKDWKVNDLKEKI